MLPDLEALRLLTEVARHGSIGAAGRSVGVSQQSASERLRALEVRTGLTLVHRDARGSRLTEEGRLLVGWSADLLAAADEVEHAITTLRRTQAQVLQVAASMTTAEFLLPGWLVRLRQQQPVNVALVATNTDGVLAAVRSQEAAIGFIEGPADLAGLRSTVVGQDHLVLVAAPDDPWATRRPLTPRTVASRSLTHRELGSGTRVVTEEAFEAAGLTPAAPEVELATNTAVAASIRAGGAPGFLSRRVVERDLALGALVEVRVTGLALERDFTAVWVGGATPPAGPVRDLLGIARTSRAV